jgi:hypothetical protein
MNTNQAKNTPSRADVRLTRPSWIVADHDARCDRECLNQRAVSKERGSVRAYGVREAAREQRIDPIVDPSRGAGMPQRRTTIA